MAWPPADGTYPSWPPPEFETTQLSVSNLVALKWVLADRGMSLTTPTGAENTLFFSNTTRCSENHNIMGRIVVSADGTRRYPFGVCNSVTHRELFVLWPPYVIGGSSGIE